MYYQCYYSIHGYSDKWQGGICIKVWVHVLYVYYQCYYSIHGYSDKGVYVYGYENMYCMCTTSVTIVYTDTLTSDKGVYVYGYEYTYCTCTTSVTIVYTTRWLHVYQYGTCTVRVTDHSHHRLEYTWHNMAALDMDGSMAKYN